LVTISIAEQTRKSLEKIGLTGYEIKTFATLLNTGEITASDLSQKCGVPYSKIYEVLGGLEEKGWIGSDNSRPTKYFAKSPNSALQTTKQRKEEEFAKNQKVILNDLTPIYKKSGTAERPDIWVLTGTMNIATRILEMIDTCREEVLIAIPKAGEELVNQALPKLRQLHDKGVKITILTSDRFDKNTLKGLSKLATIKMKKGLFGGGIVSDKHNVVILLGPEISHSNTSEIIAICTDHAELSGFAKEYFEYLLKDTEDGK
jgi:sugar-specific transcriptional regulator TrmB